eukprot:COSAG02_NODE_1080_length_14710_cov_46.078913_8_plen_63_part_00
MYVNVTNNTILGPNVPLLVVAQGFSNFFHRPRRSLHRHLHLLRKASNECEANQCVSAACWYL